MAWRTSHFVAAGARSAGGLAWASRDAWPWRRPLTAAAIVGDAAYADLTTTLGRRETLADVLARGGIRGRDYAAFLAAAKSLPVRRLRPGLKFDLRRLKTDSIAAVPPGLEPVRRAVSSHPPHVAGPRRRRFLGGVRDAGAGHGGRNRRPGRARGRRLRESDRGATPERHPHPVRPPLGLRARAPPG